jgi:hypothetical protein
MAAKLSRLKSDTTAPSGRELYHLPFSLQAASPEILATHTCMFTIELCVCVCGFLSYGQRVKMENTHNSDLMSDSDFDPKREIWKQ